MPVVPISQRTQQAQSYQPAAIKPVALDLSPVADGAKQAAQVWQKTIDDADNAAAYQAATSAQSTLNTMLWDKDTGLFNTRRGENAIGVADDGLKQFDAWAQQERGRLKNPRQVELFDKLLAAPRDGFQRQLLQHQSREFEAWQGETYKNAIQTAHEGAGLNYGDDNALDAGLIGLHGAIATRLQSQGAANLIGDEIKRATGDYYASAVVGAMANKDYARARLLLTRHDGEFSQEQRVRLDGMLKPAEAHLGAMKAVDEATADPWWTRASAEKVLRERYAQDPEGLKVARAELDYRDSVRDEGQNEVITKFMAPANQELAEAERTGRPVSMSSRALLSLAGADPTGETYRQMVGRYADYNRQLQDRELARDKRMAGITGTDPEQNASAILFDMAANPGAYKGKPIDGALREAIKGGTLRPSDALRIQSHWNDIQAGNKTLELATFSTAENYLNDLLDGAYISKGTGDTPKAFKDMEKTEQAAIKASVRLAVDRALTDAQKAEGRKYGGDEVRGVVLNAFRQATLVKKPLFGKDEKTPMLVVDPEGVGPRVGVTVNYNMIPADTRAAIESVLRKNRKPVTKQSVIEYYNAIGK